MAVILQKPDASPSREAILSQVALYPRLRYMGSKYQVMPYLVDIFERLPFLSALDAFSGSGVVAYALKCMGKQVTTNDYLTFAATVARATVENPGITLTEEDVALLMRANADGRSFISETFAGLYFPQEDHEFLDASWSHVDDLAGYKREIAVAAMCLAAARKQPRGVFTVTDLRYDDGRRQLRTPLRELFIEATQAYNRVAFDNGQQNRAIAGDVMALDSTAFDLVYFDPPYAPPRDDNDYIKRYHFLEGLAQYWQGEPVMRATKTKKIEKRFTPFAYKRTITDALRELFFRFRSSTIVLSYSSNSYPGEHELHDMLKAEKSTVEVFSVPHRYSFGTHSTAVRRQANEFIFVGR